MATLRAIENSEAIDSRDEESPLLVDNSPVEATKKNHARDVHILSSAFLLIFLAYGAAQNLESTINTVSLSVLAFFTVGLKFVVFFVWFAKKSHITRLERKGIGN